MKGKKIIVPIFLVAISLLIFYFFYYVPPDPFLEARNELANELGVEIRNYPISGFPINYFVEVLKPGMTSSEVHQIVIGYETVLVCDGNAELYYYFSVDDKKAERILIRYLDNGILKHTVTEDNNSRYLDNSVRECYSGLLGE